MKRVMLIGSIVLLAVLAVSCTSVQAYDPGTSVPASDNYNVLGLVEAEVNIRSTVLGFISWGESAVNAKQRLMINAPAGTNDIINISYEEIHKEYFFFRKTLYKLSGTAIQYY